MSSSFVCETGGEDEENSITVGISRAISAASWSGPLGIAVSFPPASWTAWRAKHDQALVERDRRDRPEVLQLNLAAVIRRGLLASGAGLGEHRRQLVRVEVTLVQQHLRASGHRGHHAGLARGPADGADPVVLEADVADRERGLRGGHEGVVPHRHRRCARVGGLAGEHRQVTLHAEGPEHGRRRLALALEHRALLDVALDVGAGAAQLGARLAGAVEVHVVARDHLLEALAVAIAQVAHLVGVERASTARRPEQAAAETGALLVGPVHEPQAYRRRPALGLGAERLDGREHAQRAVEPATRRHGVHVRADDHEAVALARHGRPQIAGGVHVHLHRQLVQSRAEEVARLRPLVGPAHAPRPVGPAGEAGELTQVLEDPVRVHDATAACAPSERRTKRP